MSGYDPLGPEERAIVDVVRDFVDRDVRPVAREWEHADRYPAELVDRMKQLGVFGLAVPAPHGAAVSTPCFALVTEELARGWMSLAGTMGGHTVVCALLVRYGTPRQRAHWLPRLATGEVRAAMALTEPGGGSDLQALRTTARRAADGSYTVDGAKTWITNARRAGLIALLVKTDPAADPPHRGMSVLLAEHGPGLTVSRDLPKLGYKGVESCELSFDGFRVPGDALLGGQEGRGFGQMMRGLEIGRIQVAARAVGVGRAAFEDSVRHARQRESFGRPIWQHQAVGGLLADMATSLTAARQLVLHAARTYDSGQRADLEAGMAKLFASETAMRIALDAVRVHGGYGYSTEFDVERYFRDAPLMIVGEGTNEIQKDVIVRQMMRRGGV
ncbi:acyl-CoA dehydrogenase family protein [Streptomyces sp. NPDC059788]|uniref:acyl-CoA dehydrogenase family protein n=1 Tax=Streptomyces sp. NPDC059788 TaxID=3346948 RepID=UPI00365D4AFF